jgi:hypothetical protein
MVETLTIKEQRIKPEGDGFSILENICHLRDIEERGYRVRIKKILNEDNPVLPDVDGALLAIEREYQKQNPKDELNEFSKYRAESLSLIKKISLEDLTRTGVMENVGEITLEKLLTIMCEHDQGHLQEISDLCGKTNQNFQDYATEAEARFS